MATLRQLKYFVEIARSQSLTKAAQSLSVAQPALSQNMASLEEELDAKLFERHAKGVTLSNAGHRLYDHAVRLLEDFEGLKKHVADDTRGPEGRVRLCLAGSIASVVIAPLLDLVERKFPRIELSLRDGMSADVLRQLEGRFADVGVMSGASELPGIEAIPVLEEEFVLLGKADRMCDFPPELSPEEVLCLPLAAPDRTFDLRKSLERVASASGQTLTLRYEINSLPMLVGVAHGELAFSLLPLSACIDAVRSGALAIRTIRGPGFTRVQSVVWPQHHPLSPAAAAVRDALIVAMHGLVDAGVVRGRRL